MNGSLRVRGSGGWLLGLGALLGVSGCCDMREPSPRPEPKPRRPNCVQLALPTGEQGSSVLLLEKCGPQQVRANVAFEYTIEARNLTDDITLRNVVVKDWAPGPFRVEGGGGGPGGEVVRLDVGELRPGESKSVRVRGVATQAGTLTNCVSADYEPYACLATQVVAPELSLRIEAPDRVLICEPSEEVTIRYIVHNPGSGEVDTVRIQAAVPRELEVLGETDRKVGNLAPGETKTWDLRVRATQPGTYVISGRATGEVEGLMADDGFRLAADVPTEPALAAQATDVRFTAFTANLALRLSGPEREYIGLPVTYRLAVTNEGDAEDRDVVVSASIPPGMTLVDASDGGGEAGGSVVWRISVLPPGATREMQFRLRGGGEERSVRLAANVVGACGGSEQAQVVTELRGVPALLVEVIDKYDPHRIGEVEEYEIRVTNQGSAPETNVQVTCEIPAEMSFMGVAGPTSGGPGEGRQIRLGPVASIPPKATVIWTVSVRCERPGDLRFGVQVTTDEHGAPVMETEATRVYE